MAQESYDLTYFDARGRGEQIRLVLEAGGIHYQDNRLACVVDGQGAPVWPPPGLTELRERGVLPFGQVPLFENGAFRIAQTSAIVMYLGKRHGMWPSSTEEEARAMMIFGAAEDLRLAKYRAQLATLCGTPEPVVGDFCTCLPAYLTGLERVLTETPGRFFISDELCSVDLSVWDVLDQIESIVPNFAELSGDPQRPLAQFRQEVCKLDKLAKYLQSRPSANLTGPFCYL